MNIETKYHGTVEINDNQIIDFTSGLPGFLQEKRFVLLPFSGNSPFFILQSVATASLAFVVTDPFSFYQDYDFTLPDASAEELGIESEADVSVFVVLTVADPFQQTTANLQAPLVLNPRQQKGKQIVLENESYGTRHLLIRPSSSAAGQEG